MRRYAVLLVIALLLAGCGSLSKDKQSAAKDPGSYVEVDWQRYTIMLPDDLAQCPGPSFVDCKVRIHQAYIELHIKHPDTGKPYWVPVIGMPMMGTPHE